jgi:hypothetical protein
LSCDFGRSSQSSFFLTTVLMDLARCQKKNCAAA